MTGTDITPLDNAVWHTLTGPNAWAAQAHGDALRFDPTVSVFTAVDRFTPQAWDDTRQLVGAGGIAVFFRAEIPPAPDGWTLLSGNPGFQMVRTARVVPRSDAPWRELTADDVPAMIALTALTKPGPFEPRTIELGRYVGVFERDQLVAMAGERFQLDEWTEVSAVCTHPDHRGKGLAEQLSDVVAAGISERGRTPILHVAGTNHNAKRVYERLGFEVRREITVHVLRAPA